MKTVLVQFRSSPWERERLKEAARVEGLSLSEWLRRLARLRTAELESRDERGTARAGR